MHTSSANSVTVRLVDLFSGTAEFWNKMQVMYVNIIKIKLNNHCQANQNTSNGLNKACVKKFITLTYFFVGNTWMNISRYCSFCQIQILFFTIKNSLKYTLFLKKKVEKLDNCYLGISIYSKLYIQEYNTFFKSMLITFSPTFVVTNAELDLEVDWLWETESASGLPCSALLLRELMTGYLFLKPCITW